MKLQRKYFFNGPSRLGELYDPTNIVGVIFASSAVIVLLNSERNFEIDVWKFYDLSAVEVIQQVRSRDGRICPVNERLKTSSSIAEQDDHHYARRYEAGEWGDCLVPIKVKPDRGSEDVNILDALPYRLILATLIFLNRVYHHSVVKN